MPDGRIAAWAAKNDELRTLWADRFELDDFARHLMQCQIDQTETGESEDARIRGRSPACRSRP